MIKPTLLMAKEMLPLFELQTLSSESHSGIIAFLMNGSLLIGIVGLLEGALRGNVQA